jgi:hypothetical protein
MKIFGISFSQFKDDKFDEACSSVNDIDENLLDGSQNEIIIYPSHLKSWCLKYFEVIG